jgi:mRNA-degrading endonuclease RelE of RelBE toxin-antitoxin system
VSDPIALRPGRYISEQASFSLVNELQSVAAFDGCHSARRGTYRLICRINEDKHVVEIHSIRHRRDSYRT